MAIVQVDFNCEILCVVDTTIKNLQSGLFRPLTGVETLAFKSWAEIQPEGVVIDPLWHPVVQDELIRTGRGKEK